MANIHELTKANFNDFIKEGTVLVDFWAGWCMPCLMMAPVFEEVSEKFEGKVKFAKIDIDDNQEIAQKYNVMSIPNFVLYKDGKKINQFVGSISAEDFERKLKEYIK